MIMNKLKMNLALIALIFPLLLHAAEVKDYIKLELRPHHKTLTEQAIPVEVFFNDSDKKLTIEFAQDWNPVTIEIKSKEGYTVYRNLYMPYSNSILSIPLENIPEGVYELTISSGNTKLIEEFINEN